MNITPEMVAAWRILKDAAAGAYRLQPTVRSAINTLDNSDFMVPIEEAEPTDEATATDQGIDRTAMLSKRVDEL